MFLLSSFLGFAIPPLLLQKLNEIHNSQSEEEGSRVVWEEGSTVVWEEGEKLLLMFLGGSS